MAQRLTEQFETTVQDLRSGLKAGKPPFIVNLRHHGDWDVGLFKARGALRLADDEVEQHLEEIPRDQDVVICYDGPGDALGVQVAEMLQQRGWYNVHPLKGGFKAYLEAGLPVEELKGRSIAKKRNLLSGS